MPDDLEEKGIDGVTLVDTGYYGWKHAQVLAIMRKHGFKIAASSYEKSRWVGKRLGHWLLYDRDKDEAIQMSRQLTEHLKDPKETL